MAQRDDVYSNNIGSKRRHHSTLRVVVRLLFGVISIVAFAALVLTSIAPRVSPEVWWGFPILGLVAPAVYLANFVIAMVWLLRWRWLAAMPFIVLLILDFGNITRFVNVDVWNHYDQSSSFPRKVKVMSYNLRSHINDSQEWSTSEIVQYVDSISPDIICLQELRDKKLESKLTPKLSNYNKVINRELGIYSRYPIVAQSDPISDDDYADGNRTMWVDVKISNDTIRVFNSHLLSTMITSSDDRYLTSREFIADTLREEKFTDIIQRFQTSSMLRAKQADTLARDIRLSPYEVLVCGDFNDTPMSYTFRTISEGLNDAFQDCGSGFAYTFRGFMNTLRIDYILASDGIRFESYLIDREITISDHLPVITHFTLTK